MIEGTDKQERQRYRDMLKELHVAVVGDKKTGVTGLAGRVKSMEEKLAKDHDLLWWNRTANGILDIIKKPVLIVITFAIILAVLGGSFLKHIQELIQGWMK